MPVLAKLKKVFRAPAKLGDLPYVQRFKIYRSLIQVSLLLIIVITAFSIKIHNLAKVQQDIINDSLSMESNALSKSKSFKARYRHHIDTQMFVIPQSLIDVKSTTMPIEFGLSMTYPESWVESGQYPAISLDNGDILGQDLQYHNVSNGIVEVMILYNANVATNFNSLLYPLDDQLIFLELSMKKENESDTDLPYLEIKQFHYHEFSHHRNYRLIESGIHNNTEVYSIGIGNTTKTFYDLLNVVYFKYSHKNIYSYLKIIQYILLSILIAIFALLINPQIGTAISGRISVIGSSVFSLSANIFQVNSLIRPVSGITLIDLLTAFAGIIILLCFLITTRTIKLNDEFGHDASKVYDLIMFKTLVVFIILFFTITYLQVA